jgi:hypothetical protein
LKLVQGDGAGFGFLLNGPGGFQTDGKDRQRDARAEAACGGKLIWSPGQWNLWNVTRIETKTVIILADPAEYLEP